MVSLILLLILAAQFNFPGIYGMAIIIVSVLGFIIKILYIVCELIKDYQKHLRLYEKSWQWHYENKTKK